MSHIAWSQMRNPILAEPDRLLKDPCFVFHEGWFYCFSHHNYRSQDLHTWEPWGERTPSQPDVTQHASIWYMASAGPRPAGWAKGNASPSYRTSATLEQWSAGNVLLPGLSEERNIDPALAWVGNRVFVAFKRQQKPHIARILPQGQILGFQDTPYRRMTLKGGSWFDRLFEPHWGEQFQLLQIDGWWHLLTTAGRLADTNLACRALYPYTYNKHPFLYRKRDDGNRLQDWQVWVGRRELVIPQERWNRAMWANGAYLCDWRDIPDDQGQRGYWYLWYAGSADHTSFDRRGHGKLGVARSRDLRRWVVPPQ